MLNRRGQIFLILLCIFTIIVLGTALFLLSQKAADFEGSIGKQQYGALKLFHANDKFLLMLEARANNDLEHALQETLSSRQDPCALSFEGDPFWYIEDRSCEPHLLDDVQSRFNQAFTPSFDAMRTEGLLRFEGPSEETFILRALLPQSIVYELTPIRDGEIAQVIATASAPWILEMQDLQQANESIASVQQFPNFRLEPRFDPFILSYLERLPARLADHCKGRSSPQLRDCVAEILEGLKQEEVILRFATLSRDRDVGIMIELLGPRELVQMHFAVRIPAEGLLFVGPVQVLQADLALPTSFRLENRNIPLEFRSNVRLPSLSGTTMELCTSPNQEPRSWTCPDKIVDNGVLVQEASGSVIADDQRSIDIKYLWSRFPQDDFLVTIKASTQTGQMHQAQDHITIFT